MRFDEIKKGQKDANGYTRCWPGKHAEGTKKGKNGGQVRNCVPNESVSEGKDEKIAQLKKDYATAVHWSKNDTNPHKREAARQKAEKIKAHLEKQYKQGVAEGLPQTLRKVVPGHAKREIDQKMDAGKFGKTDADKDANFQRYKKIQDKLKEQGVAEGLNDTQKKIEDTINKLEDRLKHAKSDEQWDNIKNRIERLQAGLKRSKQGVEEADITRRGFLKGAGAAAVAGAAGGVATKADAQEVTQWTKYATDLATRTMGRIHQDTGYDLRNWLVTNVGNWVSDYCRQTNSYNAKNVIDACNQQAYEASGLDKENKLVSAFLTNMKNRYQDFLNAYRAGISEAYQKYNSALQSQQQQKSAMGGLSEDEFSILSDALLLYAVSKEDNHPTHAQISALIGRYIKSRNNKDYVNSIYSKVNQSLAQLRPNPQLYAEEKAKLYKISNSILSSMGKIVSDSEPEFKESVNHDVAEEYNAEYDDEAGMADNNLSTLRRAVDGLDDLIDSGDNLPEWCQEKIAVAKSMLVSVWDYMESNDDAEEEFDLIESIIDRIAGQNGVDAEMVWEDLESLSHDELHAFAVTSQLNEDWSKVNKRDKTDGMSQKAVNAYRRENPGSKLKTAVTTKPSKLKKGSKASKRRKSYCSRSKGQMNMHNISCAKTPDKAICKARRRWNC